MRWRDDWDDKIYAGWLGKVIGVYLGQPVEQWPMDRIAREHGEIRYYVRIAKTVLTDDDTSGAMIFSRALEDAPTSPELSAADVAETWLNYIGDHRTTLWWGGYGRSTEHTAYENLAAGIAPPLSGSITFNGATVAEQIGGQIFIDPWGLVCPGRPDLAAAYAEKAASVSHDGEGKYGGMFVAACIAQAFVEPDIDRILAAGLAQIPSSSTYARMARDVMAFHASDPSDWRRCMRELVLQRYSYAHYPGSCHVIPNAAIIVLSLLYGEGDFNRTLCIATMAGYDTDCNVGNVGTIMGVRYGTAGIPTEPDWRGPLLDGCLFSSVIGSRNLSDIPTMARYFCRMARRIAGADSDPLPPARCHFEFAGSTHTLLAAADGAPARLTNTAERAASGSRSLAIDLSEATPERPGRIYKKTFYARGEAGQTGYAAHFSPILYPGQTVRASLCGSVPGLTARLYALDGLRSERLLGEPVALGEAWQALSFTIPPGGARIDEVGVLLAPESDAWSGRVYLDDLDWSGTPDYQLQLAAEDPHSPQWTVHRGHWTFEGGAYSGGGALNCESYTGSHEWTDYRVEATITPILGARHRLLARVQGAQRCYAVGLAKEGEAGRIVLEKKVRGRFQELDSQPFPLALGSPVTLFLQVDGACIKGGVRGGPVVHADDEAAHYRQGQIGLGVENGRLLCSQVRVGPVKAGRD
ncbi:MAG TPA: ADP-ribosylglycohydrolase family protein, partial [Limnochordia bacterium]